MLLLCCEFAAQRRLTATAHQDGLYGADLLPQTAEYPPNSVAGLGHSVSRVNTNADTAGMVTVPAVAALCLQPGMETAAAFLETRRVAAMMGATTEFEKEEGITFSAKHNKVSMLMCCYVVISLSPDQTAPALPQQLPSQAVQVTYVAQCVAQSAPCWC